MSADDVDVVIPTWNRRELLARCLSTLAAQDRRCRVIVVDNASEDGTRELVGRRFPEVEVVRLDRNLGFGSAINRGVARGAAPVVVLVNNDVECDPDFVRSIVAPLSERADVAMVAGLLLRPGRDVVDSFGLELDRTLSAYPRLAGEPYVDGRELDDRTLAMPSGGAAAYRRSAFEQVGGFDENLFAYMEDVDLGLRLRATGWESAGAADAIGVHLGSATIGRRSRRQVEIAGAARAYMLRKYGIAGRGLRTAAWAVGTEVAVVVAECVLGRDLAALRGRRAGWRLAGGSRAHVPARVVNEEIGFAESLRRRARSLG